MTSRHARHDIAESSELDCAAPLLSVYHVLHQLELQGIPLPVRVPLTCCVDFYFIRAMYVMDTRAPRHDEIAHHPPPLVLVRKPASDLNSHVLLQEMVEHDWNRRLQRDELSDEDNPHDDEEAFQKFSILSNSNQPTPNKFSNHQDENDSTHNYNNKLISAAESAQIEKEIAREMQEDYYGFRSAIVGDNTRFRGAARHAIWGQAAFFEPESQRMNIEYLNANGIRNLLRNASSRKSRCVITQFLPPDDTAPQRNEVVICTYAGMFFRMDRRINHHDYRDPSFSLNERGTCEASQHSADVSIPGVMAAKIEECLKQLVQKIEHFASKRVIVLRVAVKLRRGAVWLLYGEELVFFDRSVPRMSDPSVLFAAAAPSSRNELRKRIQIVSRRNQQSSSPQSLAQSIIQELAEARRKQMVQASEKRRQEDLAKKQWAADQFLLIQQEQQRKEQKQLKRVSSMSESRRRRHELLTRTGGIATTANNNKSPGGYLSSDQLKLMLKKNRQDQRILKNNGLQLHGSMSINNSGCCSPFGSNPASLNASFRPNQQKNETQVESVHEKNNNHDLFLSGNDISASSSSRSNVNSVDAEIGNNVRDPATKLKVARNLILGDMQEEAEVIMKLEDDEDDQNQNQVQLPNSPKSIRFENKNDNDNDDDTNLKPLSPSDYLHNSNERKNYDPFPISPSPIHRRFSTIPSVASHENDDDEGEIDSNEDFFLTENEREEQRERKRRAKLTKQEKERVHESASRWLKGEEPLFSEDDFAAIELMREELSGMSSKRLGQFRSCDGIVAPSLLFMKLKIGEAEKYDKIQEERRDKMKQQQQNPSSPQNHSKSLEFLTTKREKPQKPLWNASNESNNYDPLKRKDLLPTNKIKNQEELRQAKEEDKKDKRKDHLQDCEIDDERFWKFREKILTARVDAALRRNVLMNFRVGQLEEK